MIIVSHVHAAVKHDILAPCVCVCVCAGREGQCRGSEMRKMNETAHACALNAHAPPQRARPHTHTLAGAGGTHTMGKGERMQLHSITDLSIRECKTCPHPVAPTRHTTTRKPHGEVPYRNCVHACPTQPFTHSARTHASHLASTQRGNPDIHCCKRRRK